MSTVAGGGSSGLGDNGLAVQAILDNPGGIAVDTLGNIYIADVGNERIRKVDFSTGIITTIAGNGTAGFSGDGGLATNAMVNYVGGISCDEKNNLLIADAGNHRIRKINLSSGIVTTIAGNGVGGYSGDGGPATLAEISAPQGMCRRYW